MTETKNGKEMVGDCIHLFSEISKGHRVVKIASILFNEKMRRSQNGKLLTKSYCNKFENVSQSSQLHQQRWTSQKNNKKRDVTDGRLEHRMYKIPRNTKTQKDINRTELNIWNRLHRPKTNKIEIW